MACLGPKRLQTTALRKKSSPRGGISLKSISLSFIFLTLSQLVRLGGGERFFFMAGGSSGGKDAGGRSPKGDHRRHEIGPGKVDADPAVLAIVVAEVQVLQCTVVEDH